MCNHGCVDRFRVTRLLIAPRLSISLPALIFFAASCFPLSAQFPGAGIGYGFHVDEFDNMFAHDTFDGGGTPEMDAFHNSQRAVHSSSEPKVSVDELRHPLTERARRVLAAAWRYAKKNDHVRAISTLREGMTKVTALIPYAHALLGIEYLRVGRNAEAVPEFTEAALSFPHDAIVHSNFAVSLCVVGQYDRAEQEARMAAYLDPALESAHELLHIIEADKAAQTRR